MLQRAMNLKKRIWSLLKEIDANIKVANSYSDRSRILNNLLKADQDRFEDFVVQNPEIVHPINLDVNPEIET
jgi:uncharacterized protein YeeX (DUF496 family)